LRIPPKHKAKAGSCEFVREEGDKRTKQGGFRSDGSKKNLDRSNPRVGNSSSELGDDLSRGRGDLAGTKRRLFDRAYSTYKTTMCSQLRSATQSKKGGSCSPVEKDREITQREGWRQEKKGVGEDLSTERKKGWRLEYGGEKEGLS